jgi:hypothetical protein
MSDEKFNPADCLEAGRNLRLCAGMNRAVAEIERLQSKLDESQKLIDALQQKVHLCAGYDELQTRLANAEATIANMAEGMDELEEEVAEKALRLGRVDAFISYLQNASRKAATVLYRDLLEDFIRQLREAVATAVEEHNPGVPEALRLYETARAVEGRGPEQEPPKYWRNLFCSEDGCGNGMAVCGERPFELKNQETWKCLRHGGGQKMLADFIVRDVEKR